MRTAITVRRLIELLGKLPPDGHVVRHQWEDCLGIYARGDGRSLGDRLGLIDLLEGTWEVTLSAENDGASRPAPPGAQAEAGGQGIRIASKRRSRS